MYARTLEIEGWIRWKIGSVEEEEESRRVRSRSQDRSSLKLTFSIERKRVLAAVNFDSLLSSSSFFSRYRYWLERNVSPLARIDRIVKGGGQKDERRKSFLSKDAIVRPLRILHHEDDPSKLICSGFVIVGERKKGTRLEQRLGMGEKYSGKAAKANRELSPRSIAVTSSGYRRERKREK